MSGTVLSTTRVILSPETYETWSEDLERKLLPTGPEGTLIVRRQLPQTTLLAPDLEQARLDAGGKPIPGYFRYKTVTTSAAGVEIVTRTDTHFAEYEKAIRERAADVNRINIIIAKCAVIIVETLSDASIAVMKALDQARYTKALSNPVELLEFIDETHKLHNNANLINVVKNLIQCKQESYNNEFLPFLAEFSRCLREFQMKLNPNKDLNVAKVTEELAKAFLMVNCDRKQFHYTLDKVNSEQAVVSYVELVTQMTNYVKNNPTTSNPLALFTKKGDRKENPQNVKKMQCEDCTNEFESRILADGVTRTKSCRKCWGEKLAQKGANKTKDRTPSRTPNKVKRDDDSKKTPSKPKYDSSERILEEQEKKSAMISQASIQSDSEDYEE